MAKTYLIPHNYTNNGRIFNLFDKKRLTQALIWFIPSTIGVFSIPMDLSSKIFWWILACFPPAVAILAGYADWIKYFLIFMQNRRIYYNVDRSDANAFLYLRLKAQEVKNKADNNS